MGRLRDEIDEVLEAFLLAQHVFFVASAPLSPSGHVNCSPKGIDGTFAVLGPRTVGYLDLSGSGAETVAHLRENGRITLMFCAFSGQPRIVRLWGTGSVAPEGSERYEALRDRFAAAPGARAVIVVEVERIADSCGYGVPLMDYAGERPHMSKWAERKGPEGLLAYRAENNATSIDGLVAFGEAASANAPLG